MGNLYTIGHSTVPFEKFLQLLQQYKVDFILDVRSIPYSAYASQFNREALAKELERYGIQYQYMGTYFGARQKDINLYTQEGYLDFEKVRAQECFKRRVTSVIRGLKQNYNIALMCTEKDPIDCHRAIMVGRAFELAGITVSHILHSGKLESQNALNERLVRRYYPGPHQMDLFANEQKTDEEYLQDAYRQRNREIGYRWQSKQEKVG